MIYTSLGIFHTSFRVSCDSVQYLLNFKKESLIIQLRLDYNHINKCMNIGIVTYSYWNHLLRCHFIMLLALQSNGVNWQIVELSGQKSCWYDWANESSRIKVNLIYFDTHLLYGSSWSSLGFCDPILRWSAQNNDDWMIWSFIICFSL